MDMSRYEHIGGSTLAILTRQPDKMQYYRKYAAKVGQDNVNIGVVTIFRLAKTSLLQVY